MTTKKDDPSPIPQKMASKKEEPSTAQLKITGKKEESSAAQLKMAGKKEEPSASQLKIAGKKEEPSAAQLKMASKKEEPSAAQLKMASKKEESSASQLKMVGKKEEPSAAQLRIASKKEDPPQLPQKMPSKKEELELSQGQQGDAAVAAAAPGSCPAGKQGTGNLVLKSGTLFLSSKGIGWTSWKKRWFILTPTSLVFFRSDPSAVAQKGNEVNLTLGGIDLNNSGSVVVKPDKKLITVQFHDGRDARTFTLKAETLEDLHEWKAALENALSQAPSSANVTGQNGNSKNDQADAVDGSKEPVNDKQPVKPTVIGRPILLALEDVDGAPTFLEKALRFMEEHGVRVEGILRQAADVELVKHRIQEYEQGKTEFSSEEDAHVIADCVKYIIRELPSSPVPASCCSALLEASRTQRGSRVNAMRLAVLDTFPEPNRRLLQRILLMMQTIASHKNKNLMSTSAVAACMAPLLLRPLLSGDCEIETDFDVGGDNSMQLLQAAAAANHAQAIVITLLEEYDQIFGEGSISSDIYSDSEEESESENEEDDESYDEDESDEEDEGDDATEGSDVSNDDETDSESGQSVTNDQDVDENSDSSSSSSESSESGDDVKATNKPSSSIHNPLSEKDDSQRSKDNHSKSTETETNKSAELSKGVHGPANLEDSKESTDVGSKPGRRSRHNAVWGRTSARKNLSMESMDIQFEEESEIEALEAEKSDLQNRLRDEIEGNTKLEASVEKRKNTLHGHHLDLEKDIARLKEELQRERDKRTALESGLNSSEKPISLPDNIDLKTKAHLEYIAQEEAEIINLKKRVEDLRVQINQQHEKKSTSMNDSCNQRQPDHHAKVEDKPKGTDAAFKGSGSKGSHVDRKEFEKGRKQESSLESKHPPRNQQLDDPVDNRNRMNVAETDSRKSHTSSNAKKSDTKGEEQRSQTASEISDKEKGRGSSQAVPSSDKEKGSGANQISDKEKGRGSSEISDKEKGRSSSHVVPSSDKEKGRGSSQAVPSSDKEKGRGSSHAVPSSDKEKGRGLSHVVPSSDKEKGHGSSEISAKEKGRGSSQAVPSSDKEKSRGSSQISDKEKGRGASEISDKEKGRGSSQAVPSSDKEKGRGSSEISDKEKGRGASEISDKEKGRGSSQVVPSSEKGRSVQSFQVKFSP